VTHSIPEKAHCPASRRLWPSGPTQPCQIGKRPQLSRTRSVSEAVLQPRNQNHRPDKRVATLLMSVVGQKRTWRDQISMSALPPKADMVKFRCPLYPRKRTFAHAIRMSALGQKRTHAAQQNTSFIRSLRRRGRAAIYFCQLLDRQARISPPHFALLAFKNTVIQKRGLSPSPSALACAVPPSKRAMVLVSVTKLCAFASRHARVTISCSSCPACAFG
jgi:hypothetical protein